MIKIRGSQLMKVFICSSLVCGHSASAAAKSHRLEVKDITGYYVTDSKNATANTMCVSFVATISKGNNVEECDFTGMYGSSAIVGLGTPTGGTDDGQVPNNMILFDFMYIDAGPSSILMRSTSIMSKGRVVGLRISQDDNNISASGGVRYRRVSQAQYLLYCKHYE